MKPQKGASDAIKQIGDYTICMKDILGSGSFGVVYKCTDKQNEVWAAKQISKNLINGKKDYLEKLLRQEVGVQKQMKSENIVRLKEFLISDNNYYLILDYCNAGNLKQQIQKEKKFSENKAKQIMIQIMSGLKEMYQRSIVHRDIKPENILVAQTPQGFVYKLADFGFAKILNNQDMIKSQVGTPLYMDPQILLGKPYDSKCDIWSVGIIFYELLYGCTPWPRVTSQYDLLEKIKKIPIRFQEQISVSEKAKSLIKKMLQIEPTKRISYQELFEDNYFQAPQSCLFTPSTQKEMHPTISDNEIQKDQLNLKPQQSEKQVAQKNKNQIFQMNENKFPSRNVNDKTFKNENQIIQKNENQVLQNQNQISLKNENDHKNENKIDLNLQQNNENLLSLKSENQINHKNKYQFDLKSGNQAIIKNINQNIDFKSDISEKTSEQSEQNLSDENYAKLYQLLEFSKQDFEQFNKRMFTYNFGCLDKTLFQQFVQTYLGKGDHSIFFDFILKLSIKYNLVKSPDNKQKVLLEDLILIFKKYDQNFKFYVQEYLKSQNLIQNLSSFDSSEQKKEINQTQKLSVNIQSNNYNFDLENKSNKQSEEVSIMCQEKIDLQQQCIPNQSKNFQNQVFLLNEQQKNKNQEEFPSFQGNKICQNQLNLNNNNNKFENLLEPSQINLNKFSSFENNSGAVNFFQQKEDFKEKQISDQIVIDNNFTDFKQGLFNFQNSQSSQKIDQEMPCMQGVNSNNFEFVMKSEANFNNNNQLLATNFCLQNTDKSLDPNIFLNLQKNVENILYVKDYPLNEEDKEINEIISNKCDKIENQNEKIDQETQKNQINKFLDPFDCLPDPLEEYRKNITQHQKRSNKQNNIQSMNYQINQDVVSAYQVEFNNEKNTQNLIGQRNGQDSQNQFSLYEYTKNNNFDQKENLLSNNFETSLRIANENNKENISDNIQQPSTYQKSSSLNEIQAKPNLNNLNLDQPILKNYVYSRNESIAHQSQSTNYQSQAQTVWQNSSFPVIQIQKQNQDLITNLASKEAEEQLKNTFNLQRNLGNCKIDANEPPETKIQNNENQISLFDYSLNFVGLNNDIPKKENLINPNYIYFYNINNHQAPDLNLNYNQQQQQIIQESNLNMQNLSPSNLKQKNDPNLEASPSIGEEASYLDNQILEFTPNYLSDKGYWDDDIDKQNEKNMKNPCQQKKNFIQNPLPFLHNPNNINNLKELKNPISNDSLSYILFN
ncbi:Serine/Threonine kinase domain protein (macronuclear) [Tetrahymena thermophila SB210]|uniref:Serine/Threonine kinase domain protein n=1 Tax=Tetrahymena thermophila (strain SB210) TaxID=312017 RepID=Q24DK4_TETTS|nr:Serine/Threonine kinase domain protein [Tetrahymena thermophila SB210]EAS05844.2 Serine/Threonine kinase domain protein [Tetrahymena thermophila SB210]|eukprot:XP_001026089.2 Serine/Threonine kinase domain protein [Tetrahymena thermophila SB210]